MMCRGSLGCVCYAQKALEFRDVNVKQGEIVHVESRFYLHNQAWWCDCVKSVLRDSFVHHFSRYLHGALIERDDYLA